jgi:hypothetical protein
MIQILSFIRIMIMTVCLGYLMKVLLCQIKLASGINLSVYLQHKETNP